MSGYRLSLSAHPCRVLGNGRNIGGLMTDRIREMIIVTMWVLGIVWVARQAAARVPALAPLGRFLP